MNEDNHVKAYKDHQLDMLFELKTSDASKASGALRESFEALDAARKLDPGERAAAAALRAQKNVALGGASDELAKLRTYKHAVDSELSRCKRNLQKLGGSLDTGRTPATQAGLSEAYYRQQSVYEHVREQEDWLENMIKAMQRLVNKARAI